MTKSSQINRIDNRNIQEAIQELLNRTEAIPESELITDFLNKYEELKNLYNNVIRKDIPETINQVWTFDKGPVFHEPVLLTEAATKNYVDSHIKNFLKNNIPTDITAKWNFEKRVKCKERGYENDDLVRFDQILDLTKPQTISSKWTFTEPVTGVPGVVSTDFATVGQVTGITPILDSKLDKEQNTEQTVKGPVKFAQEVYGVPGTLPQSYITKYQLDNFEEKNIKKDSDKQQIVTSPIKFNGKIKTIEGFEDDDVIIKSQLSPFFNKIDTNLQTITGPVNFSEIVKIEKAARINNAFFSGELPKYEGKKLLTEDTLDIYSWNQLPTLSLKESTSTYIPTEMQPVIKKYLDERIDKQLYVPSDFPKLNTANKFTNTNDFPTITINGKFLDTIYLRKDNTSDQEVSGKINFTNGILIKGQVLDQIGPTLLPLIISLASALVTATGVLYIKCKIKDIVKSVPIFDSETKLLVNDLSPINDVQFHIASELIDVNYFSVPGWTASILPRSRINEKFKGRHLPYYCYTQAPFNDGVICTTGMNSFEYDHDVTKLVGYYGDVQGVYSYIKFIHDPPYNDHMRTINSELIHYYPKTNFATKQDMVIKNIAADILVSKEFEIPHETYNYYIGYLESNVMSIPNDQGIFKEYKDWRLIKSILKSNIKNSESVTNQPIGAGPYSSYKDLTLNLGKIETVGKAVTSEYEIDPVDKIEFNLIKWFHDSDNFHFHRYQFLDTVNSQLQESYQIGNYLFYPGRDIPCVLNDEQFEGAAHDEEIKCSHEKDTLNKGHIRTITITQNSGKIKSLGNKWQEGHDKLEPYEWKSVDNSITITHNDSNQGEIKNTDYLQIDGNFKANSLVPGNGIDIKLPHITGLGIETKIKKYCYPNPGIPQTYDFHHKFTIGEHSQQYPTKPRVLISRLMSGLLKAESGSSPNPPYNPKVVFNFDLGVISLSKPGEKVHDKTFKTIEMTGYPSQDVAKCPYNKGSMIRAFCGEGISNSNDNTEIMELSTFDGILEHIKHGTNLLYKAATKELIYQICPDPCNSDTPGISVSVFNSSVCPIGETSTVKIKNKIVVKDKATITDPTTDIEQMLPGEIVTKEAAKELEQEFKNDLYVLDSDLSGRILKIAGDVTGLGSTIQELKELYQTMKVIVDAINTWKSTIQTTVEKSARLFDLPKIKEELDKLYPTYSKEAWAKNEMMVGAFINPFDPMGMGGYYFGPSEVKASKTPGGIEKTYEAAEIGMKRGGGKEAYNVNTGSFSLQKAFFVVIDIFTRLILSGLPFGVGPKATVYDTNDPGFVMFSNSEVLHHLPVGEHFKVDNGDNSNDAPYIDIERTQTINANGNIEENSTMLVGSKLYAISEKQNNEDEDSLVTTHGFTKKYGFDYINEDSKRIYKRLEIARASNLNDKTIITIPENGTASIKIVNNLGSYSSLNIKKDKITFIDISGIEKELVTKDIIYETCKEILKEYNYNYGLM